MVCGWVMIFGGTYLYFRRTKMPIEHEVDHTFLELERQAQSGDVHPRVMEPFIGMTLEVENNLQMLEECKMCIPQLIWLVDYPNVRIQYQALWAIANLGQHKGCRTLIMNSQSRESSEIGIEVLFRTFMSHKSQPALKMEVSERSERKAEESSGKGWGMGGARKIKRLKTCTLSHIMPRPSPPS